MQNVIQNIVNLIYASPIKINISCNEMNYDLVIKKFTQALEHKSPMGEYILLRITDKNNQIFCFYYSGCWKNINCPNSTLNSNDSYNFQYNHSVPPNDLIIPVTFSIS